jgi:hypothetical protein
LLYLASINLHPDNTFNSCNPLINLRTDESGPTQAVY